MFSFKKKKIDDNDKMIMMDPIAFNSLHPSDTISSALFQLIERFRYT